MSNYEVTDARKWAVEMVLQFAGTTADTYTTDQIIERADALANFVLYGPEGDRPTEGKFTAVRRELSLVA